MEPMDHAVDLRARGACLDRRGEPRAAAADDNDVEGLFQFAHPALTARPALLPAIRPNTAPDIKPVPPG